MIHINIPLSGPRRLAFYLAAEEWAARSLPAAEYFFSWRVLPTVICGRNQEMRNEVDMNYCRSAGIDVVRRRSGGGCVYADMNNLMFSYICPGDEVTTTFAHYTLLIASRLQALGLDAQATGRNDILVGAHKVAGNAFYHLPGRCIVHGTMLYDVDLATMSRAITPSRAKLMSKGVKSVQKRVTCLKDEGIKLSLREFEEYMIRNLCDAEIMVMPEDIAVIEEIERAYYEPDFLYRKEDYAPGLLRDSMAYRHDPDRSVFRKGRIEGVGELDFTFLLDDEERIKSMSVEGDFFVLDDPERHIFRHLRGRRLVAREIREALEEATPGEAIAGLTADALCGLLLKR